MLLRFILFFYNCYVYNITVICITVSITNKPFQNPKCYQSKGKLIYKSS